MSSSEEKTLKEIVDSLPATNKDTANSYFCALSEALDFVEKIVIRHLEGVVAPNKAETAVLGIYYRMCLVVRATCALNQPKYFQTVAANARTMFELLIDLKSMVSDKTDLSARQYEAFSKVERFRSAKLVADFVEKEPDAKKFFDQWVHHRLNLAANIERKAKIEEEIKKLWGINEESGALRGPR